MEEACGDGEREDGGEDGGGRREQGGWNKGLKQGQVFASADALVTGPSATTGAEAEAARRAAGPGGSCQRSFCLASRFAAEDRHRRSDFGIIGAPINIMGYFGW